MSNYGRYSNFVRMNYEICNCNRHYLIDKRCFPSMLKVCIAAIRGARVRMTWCPMRNQYLVLVSTYISIVRIEFRGENERRYNDKQSKYTRNRKIRSARFVEFKINRKLIIWIIIMAWIHSHCTTYNVRAVFDSIRGKIVVGFRLPQRCNCLKIVDILFSLTFGDPVSNKHKHN